MFVRVSRTLGMARPHRSTRPDPDDFLRSLAGVEVFAEIGTVLAFAASMFLKWISPILASSHLFGGTGHGPSVYWLAKVEQDVWWNDTEASVRWLERCVEEQDVPLLIFYEDQVQNVPMSACICKAIAHFIAFAICLNWYTTADTLRH